MRAGRGKAGGVKLVDSPEAVGEFAAHWLGQRLVTYQTDAAGQPVSRILVESCTDIADELYLGAVVDRASRRIVFMASTEGGVEIEKVAEETPEKILKAEIDPLVGAQPFQGRDLAFRLGLTGVQVKQFVTIFMGLAKLFADKDLALIEVNPLVITDEGSLHCLDAKVVVDSNALYRQPELEAMHDPSQEDDERRLTPHSGSSTTWPSMAPSAAWSMAQDWQWAPWTSSNSTAARRRISLMSAAGATKERVTEAFKIILSDENVKAVLINIFGGIVRCDLIAEGVIGAVEEVGVDVPVCRASRG